MNYAEENNYLLKGQCPECKRIIKGWEPMFGSFTPEWWATMKERGIDPGTGHSAHCRNKTLKL